MPVHHSLPWKVFAMLALLCMAGVTGPAAASAAPTSVTLLFSPYKYLPRFLDTATGVAQTAVTGTTLPLVGTGGLLPAQLPNLHAITLAFATGKCDHETWHGVPRDVAIKTVHALANANVDYLISTGGSGATFTCATPQAFTGFIRRYLTPHMLGVDFDIESNQTPAEISALVADSAYAQRQFPRLRFAITLATWAGSDGSHNGLNQLGETVIKAIKASTLSHYVINLMVMDYGKSNPHRCVMVAGACQMGLSAIQAVRNLQHDWGIPADKIALTPIIGVNDNADEITTLDDLDTITRYAVDHHLAGIHFWSLDRDTPCPASSDDRKAKICNGTGDPALAYTRRVLRDLGR